MEMADYFSVFLVNPTDTESHTALEDHGDISPDEPQAHERRLHYSNRHTNHRFPLRARPEPPPHQAQVWDTKGKEKRYRTTEVISCPLYWRNVWMPFVAAGRE